MGEFNNTNMLNVSAETSPSENKKIIIEDKTNKI